MSQNSQSTQLAIQYLSQGYTYLYDHLRQSNIPAPEPESVFYFFSMVTNAFLTHSPATLRQFNTVFQNLSEQFSPLTLFLGLVVLYLVYCSLMTTARWAYRIISGVMRMTILMIIIGFFGYLAQVYTTDGPTGVMNALQDFTRRAQGA
ncbi:hypothetical protein CLU79DRAFT_741581 [Phycomyces nitens]|nr:hypothetical protein CLU79DRAFT_741581 [Phycomyces nitens]